MSGHSDGPITIHPVKDKNDTREFVELAFRLNRGDPAWVPPLKGEVYSLLTPGKNPWFEHGKAQLFVARRKGRTVGRISAHFDELALKQPAEQGMGPGTGNWGLLEAEDEETTRALLAAAEDWLRRQGMHRSLGPLSISVWDEPGLLIEGFDNRPTVMMGHNSPLYRGWVEGSGYRPIKQLINYDVYVKEGFSPLVNRIVAAGEKNARIRVRKVDKRNFDAEAALIMGLLNDAWSDNWGFVPLTDSEIAFVGKKLKTIVFEDLVRVAELDGEAVAFIIVLPNINELLIDMDGRLLPFNWARLLWWLRKPKSHTLRVPLMGVAKKLQNSRMASTLAFMMIELIRRDAVRDYSTERGDIGWVLDDNQGMNAVAEAINANVNRVYQIYDKML
mgnify:FL=1